MPPSASYGRLMPRGAGFCHVFGGAFNVLPEKLGELGVADTYETGLAATLADLDPRLEAFVAAGNFSPHLGARYLEFENLRQDTAYDFLLRPPTTASSGRFLCHEVPLSANIARLMPPWRPFFAPFSASD